MKDDMLRQTIENTNRSIIEYIKTRSDPKMVMNHLKKFLELTKKGGYVIDLGCGHGRDIKFFEENGLKPVGIDLSDKMIEVAKDKCGSVILKLDMREINKVPWKFDCAWSCGAMYHLGKEDFKDVLLKLFSILKPGGIFFLAIKEGKGESMVLKSSLGVIKFYSLFSREEIETMLEDVGFIILETIVEEKEDTWINIFSMRGMENTETFK